MSSATERPSPVRQTPSPPVAFSFAGVQTDANVSDLDALRATVTWTVEPVLIPGYAASTWIAFAAPGGSGGVSYQIAQVGWIESDPGDPHLFWEWGTTSSDHHQQIGTAIQRGVPLNLEIDRDGNGLFTFYANNLALGTGQVSWTPTAAGAFAETHLASEYLPGSEAQPELVTSFEEKAGGQWISYAGQALTTRSDFRVTIAADLSLRIWDVRQPTTAAYPA